MQNHHVTMICELSPRELTSGALHDQRVGTSRHRQHDVEGLASISLLRDVRATQPPLIDDVAHRILPLALSALVVLHRQPTIAADVAHVCRNGGHASAAAGHLDHHLRRATNRAFDSRPDRGGASTDRRRGESRGRGLRNAPVVRKEQPLTPLHERAVDESGIGHGSPPWRAMTRDASSRCRRTSPTNASAESRYRSTPSVFA